MKNAAFPDQIGGCEKSMHYPDDPKKSTNIMEVFVVKSSMSKRWFSPVSEKKKILWRFLREGAMRPRRREGRIYAWAAPRALLREL